MSKTRNEPLRGCGGTYVQSFPLEAGRVNLTSSSSPLSGWSGAVIFCVADGTFDLTFAGEETAVTIQMYEGWDFALPDGSTVDFTDTEGTFHLSA